MDLVLYLSEAMVDWDTPCINSCSVMHALSHSLSTHAAAHLRVINKLKGNFMWLSFQYFYLVSVCVCLLRAIDILR
jgi:hypothetical protein